MNPFLLLKVVLGEGEEGMLLVIFFFYFLETKAISFKIPVLQQVLVKRVTGMCEVLDSMTEVKVTSTPNEDWTGCEP